MTLSEIVAEAKAKSFSDPSGASDEEALGLVVARYCGWDDRITDVVISAYEDANFHAWAELAEATRGLTPSQVRTLVTEANSMALLNG